MTLWTLIRRSLRFHARAHVGVVLGAVIGSAAFIGALVVGDSVKGSLQERALEKLDGAYFALAPPDRVFSADLKWGILTGKDTVQWFDPKLPPALRWKLNPAYQSLGPTMLSFSGTASLRSGSARANHVQVFGVNDDFWGFTGTQPYTNQPKQTVVLNEALAAQIGAGVGDSVILRVPRKGEFSTDAAIAPRDKRASALSVAVARVLPANAGGDLELNTGGAPPLNAFVRLDELAKLTELEGKANVMLLGPLHESRMGANSFLNHARYWWSRLLLRRLYRLPIGIASTVEMLDFLANQLQHNWSLVDAGLKLDYAPDSRGIELRSARVFLESPVVSAATSLGSSNAIPILTYLANLISSRTNSTPYSMVTAAGPPYTPADMGDDEIVLCQWLAEDLRAAPGDTISLSYFDPESGAKLNEHTNSFRVRSVVPMELPWADRTLMPDFPGIENAESARDWDAGFPLTYTLRPKDEDYWKKYRGTPKAFITLAAGQRMWANRFGQVTAIRFPEPPGMPTAELSAKFKDKLLATLRPEELGLHFEPVREQALKAADQSQDFGQLFLGFSIFLVVAALLLMALLFQFALEQRAAEVGTLLALGFTARQVRRLLLLEGAALALVGGALGALCGLGYAKAMLWGLTTVWRSAVGSSALQFHATTVSLVLGASASTLVACLVIWLTLRKQARQPATELLAGQFQSQRPKARTRGAWIALAAAFVAVAVVVWALLSGETANAEAFFSAGALLLIAGLALSAAWMTALARRGGSVHLTTGSLGVRSCARRRNRSLATMALLACGCFVIVAIGVFRLDANRDAMRRTAGTGGFALLGQSTMPVAQDLNTKPGREAFGLDAQELAGVNVVPLRVREGDEASCLNLNRAQKPRLLGVRPELLEGRFTFANVANGLDSRQGWQLLSSRRRKEVPIKNPELEKQMSAIDQRLLTSAATASGEVPAIGDANSIQWALGKKIGDTIDYTDEHGQPFKLRLVGAVANSILQGNLIFDEAEFVKRFPGQSGYCMFLIDAPSNRAAQVSTTLSRALQDLGLEVT